MREGQVSWNHQENVSRACRPALRVAVGLVCLLETVTVTVFPCLGCREAHFAAPLQQEHALRVRALTQALSFSLSFTTSLFLINLVTLYITLQVAANPFLEQGRV